MYKKTNTTTFNEMTLLNVMKHCSSFHVLLLALSVIAKVMWQKVRIREEREKKNLIDLYQRSGKKKKMTRIIITQFFSPFTIETRT